MKLWEGKLLVIYTVSIYDICVEIQVFCLFVGQKTLIISYYSQISICIAIFYVLDISDQEELEAGSGCLQSPNYPAGYANNLDYSATIFAPEGMVCNFNLIYEPINLG